MVQEMGNRSVAQEAAIPSRGQSLDERHDPRAPIRNVQPVSAEMLDGSQSFDLGETHLGKGSSEPIHN